MIWHALDLPGFVRYKLKNKRQKRFFDVESQEPPWRQLNAVTSEDLKDIFFILGLPCAQIASLQGGSKGCGLRLAFEALTSIPGLQAQYDKFNTKKCTLTCTHRHVCPWVCVHRRRGSIIFAFKRGDMGRDWGVCDISVCVCLQIYFYACYQTYVQIVHLYIYIHMYILTCVCVCVGVRGSNVSNYKPNNGWLIRKVVKISTLFISPYRSSLV